MPEGSAKESLRPAVSAGFLRQVLARYPRSPRYWIAYSGGLDSRVLLELCAQLYGGETAPDFTAVHVHHGLHPEAGQWAEHCRGVSESAGIGFRLVRVDARPQPGQSPEEAARRARYEALRSLLGDGDSLLTAQHRDDQAETLLLQLLRGSGLAGLAAMPERTVFPPGFLMRPLLAFSRAELQSYAESRGIGWIEDPSNRDLNYDRNFIRRRVVPLLRERWPAAPETLCRSAKHCAEAQETLASLARDLCAAARHPDRNTLLVTKLTAYSDADRRLVLREWLKAGGFRMPSRRILDQVSGDVLKAGADRNPAVRWSEGIIRRYRNELYLLPPIQGFDPTAVVAWDGESPLRLPDNGELRADPTDGRGIDADIWRSGTISVRYRRGGERFRPAGRGGSHELKKLLQEAGMPPWVRERIPLICLDGRLAAVGNGWLAAEFVPDSSKERIKPRWDAPEWLQG